MNDLIKMFNSHHDYVIKQGDTYYPAIDVESATHRLHCTTWNSKKLFPKDRRKAIREFKTRPAGYALAVCAVPLHQTPPGRRHTSLKLSQPADLFEMPVYRRSAPIAGKRRVLNAWCVYHPTPTKFRKHIQTLPAERLDRLYKHLLRANRQAWRKAKRAMRRAQRHAT